MAPTPLPRFPPDFTSLATAARVTPVTHTAHAEGAEEYSADLRADWCIGVVPHGGYLTSLLLTTTVYAFTHSAHYTPLNQPHAITCAVTFLARADIGACRLVLTPLKLGRQYSFVRVDLVQAMAVRLTAVITHANLYLEHGISLNTLPPPPIVGKDKCRIVPHDWTTEFRAAERKLVFAYPKKHTGGERRSVTEQWVKLDDGSGDKLGLESLGFLSDMFVPVPENYRHENVGANGEVKYWYPTLTLLLDVKKVPPPGGWEWVGVRVEAGDIRNGRMDLNVVMYDERHEVVARSQHVAIVVGVERNRKRTQEVKL